MMHEGDKTDKMFGKMTFVTEQMKFKYTKRKDRYKKIDNIFL